MRYIVAVVCTIVLALGPVVPAGADNLYGAIAISPSTGKHAGSWDFTSQTAADQRAISRCNALGPSDCIATVMIHNRMCGALAQDTSRGTWKDGHGNTRSEASSNALANLGSSNGTVVETVCNNNSGGGSNSSGFGAAQSRYGAIAISPSTGKHAGSWDFSSQSAADTRAISRCNALGQNDCVAAVKIHNNVCGALAEDVNQGTWKDGHGNTRDVAKRDAISRLGASNATVVESVCNSTSSSGTTTSSSSSSNAESGVLGFLLGAAAIAALTHHKAPSATSSPVPTPSPSPAPTATPVPTPTPVVVLVTPTPVPQSVARVAPPPVTSFGGGRFGAIALDARGTYAALARDRDSQGAAMTDAVNDCNAKTHGASCTVHVQFSSTVPDQMCAAVAIRRHGKTVDIASATAENERDAEGRALVKGGTGATLLAHGCNSP